MKHSVRTWIDLGRSDLFDTERGSVSDPSCGSATAQSQDPPQVWRLSRLLTSILAAALMLPCMAHADDNTKKDQKKQAQESPLDVYIDEAHKRAANSYGSPGSLFTGP